MMKNIFFFLVITLTLLTCNASKSALQEGEWQGKGANPFWNLEIKKTGIVFEFVGGDRYEFPYTEPVNSNERLLFVTNSGTGDNEHWIKINLTKESCQNSSVSTKMPYKVEITLDQKELYYGCATNE